MNAPVTITEEGAVSFVAEPETALAVLTDKEKAEAFFVRVKAEVEAHVPDLTTDKGRKAIASLARKVVTSKTALDEAGKKLTEDKRREIAAVDAARKNIRDRLDGLRDIARKPLTDWEAAEEKRVEFVKTQLERLKQAAVVSVDDTGEGIEGRLDWVAAIVIDPDTFQEYGAAAKATQETTLATLGAAIVRMKREAEERAELERLRAAEAARLEREEADRVAAEAKAREEAQAKAQAEREAEAKRQAEERAAREAKEREETAAKAAEDAKAEAARKAAAEAAEVEARHQAEVSRLKREADERIAQAAAAERERDAAAKREADAAEAQRKADEARAADRAHRGEIMGQAKAALMEIAGIDEEAAKKAVLAIGAGEIPHVSIRF